MAESTLTITTSDDEIRRRIKTAINKAIFIEEGKKFHKKIQKLQDEMWLFLYRAFLKSEIYESLINGELRAEFGLDNNGVNGVADMLYEIINPKIVYDIGSKKNGMVKIIITPISFEDIDFEKYGVYISEPSGEKIPWLKWLLTEGQNIVVKDYFIRFLQGKGRSEMAIMINEEKSSYSVDGYFAGVENDNWFTRTLINNKGELISLIKEIMNAP